MDPALRDYLATIGRRGGQRSRRVLRREDAQQMVRIREARRAYRRFHASCFWSYPPDLRVDASNVEWVAERLMRVGGREAWIVGARLCGQTEVNPASE